jgi:hypothetical protein
VHDALAHHFGSQHIFMDIDDISAGMVFAHVLDRALAECDILLALIGPRWLARSGRLGRRRLDDPKDFVRLEIAAALERGITVVPVLVQDARMPTSLQLPNSLMGLADIQASELSDRRWGADVRRLIGTLERLSLASSRGPGRHPAPEHAPREAQTPKSAPPKPVAAESDRRPPTVVSAAEIKSARIARVPAGAEDVPSPGGAVDRLRSTSRTWTVTAAIALAVVSMLVGILIWSRPTLLDAPPSPVVGRAGTTAVRSEDISPAMKAAIVAVLDPRFYMHGGVDWTGDLTITQRYVLNYRSNVAAPTDGDRVNDVSPISWLRVARAALTLEDEMSKEDILSGYLNTVFLGRGAYGVEAASRTYWNTTPSQLSIPQAALLAGMADDPKSFDPFTYPLAAVDRRNAVIAAMADQGMIDLAQLAEAQKTPLVVSPG